MTTINKSKLAKTRIFFLFFGAMLSILSIGFYLIVYQDEAAYLRHSLKNYSLVFMIFRYSVLGFLFLFWPQVIKIMGKRKQWSEDLIRQLCQKRKWALGFFILIESVVVFNVPGKLLAHWFGS